MKEQTQYELLVFTGQVVGECHVISDVRQHAGGGGRGAGRKEDLVQRRCDVCLTLFALAISVLF